MVCTNTKENQMAANMGFRQFFDLKSSSWIKWWEFWKFSIFNILVITTVSKNHLPLQDAKIPIKDQLIASNDAILYKEPESKIMSRSGDECVVSLCDQWYLVNLTRNFRFLSICSKNIIKTKQSRNLEPESNLVFIID